MHQVMAFFWAAASWASVALWLIADRSLHGGVTPDHLMAAAGIVVVGTALGVICSSRKDSPVPDPRAQDVGVPCVAILIVAVLGSGASVLEVAFRDRPDDSTTLLVASLAVHLISVTVFVWLSLAERLCRSITQRQGAPKS